mmetsp:Transcript_24847/g.34785  ORF Transcript_24847/g.34785 Transcript_24847/m.34785 type:complete len:91 (+) Transcript_24847:72-344(+)
MSYRQSTGGSTRPSNAAPIRASSPSGAPRSSFAGGVRRRTGGKSGSGGGLLGFYTEDSQGLKVGPTAVLVMSLGFIAFVILLHIWGKLRG